RDNSGRHQVLCKAAKIGGAGLHRDNGGLAAMKKGLRLRFWLEAGLGVITTVLFVVTVVTPDWIEQVFGLDPDGGNGSVERLIVGGLAAVTVAVYSFSLWEWRRASTAAA